MGYSYDRRASVDSEDVPSPGEAATIGKKLPVAQRKALSTLAKGQKYRSKRSPETFWALWVKGLVHTPTTTPVLSPRGKAVADAL